jgi:hypothetical protein
MLPVPQNKAWCRGDIGAPRVKIGGAAGAAAPLQNKIKKKNTIIWKALHDLRFVLNQLSISADDWYSVILKSILKTWEYVDILSFSVLIFPVT